MKGKPMRGLPVMEKTDKDRRAVTVFVYNY